MKASGRGPGILRDEGIEVRTVGSGNDVGYLIDPEEYYLPDLGLTDDETVALNVALSAVQIEGELVERARLRIAELAKRLGLENCERIVQTGNIKADVVRIAQERGVDLIVIGSRERHGVSILFNFTEDTVLHAAPCDVLAVRLPRDGRAAAAAHGNS